MLSRCQCFFNNIDNHNYSRIEHQRISNRVAECVFIVMMSVFFNNIDNHNYSRNGH